MKKIVCVDLDGVLADYSGGWRGLDKIGDPIPGAVEFTKRLTAFARVVIFTTRCKCDMPDRDEVWRQLNRNPQIGTEEELASALREVVKTWLDRHGFAYDDIYTGQGKPYAAAYVDDRAVICRPQSPFVSQMDERDPDVFTAALWATNNMCGE